MRAFPFAPIALVAILFLQVAQVQKSDEAELSAICCDKATASIATGNLLPLRRAPAVATEITAEEIAATGAFDFTKVSESVSGMYVSHDALFYSPKYKIRGIGLVWPNNS